MNWLKRLKNENGPDTDTPKPTKPGFGGFGVPISGAFVEKKAEAEGFGGFGVPIPGHIENSMMAAVVVMPVPDWATGPANDSTVEAAPAVKVAPGATLDSRAPVAVVMGAPGAPIGRPAEAIGTVPVSADTDRYCWPNSSAMNTAEINRFTGRVALFKVKGLTPTEADALADKLVTRDRDGDDRRVCLECANLSGWNGRRQCRGLHHAGMGGPMAAAGQVAVLQRCDGFKGAA